MERDKRKGIMPIPTKLENWLNEEQKTMLATIENYGWELKYIRRPHKQDPTIIVVNAQGDQVGILENDGQLNLESGVVVR